MGGASTRSSLLTGNTGRGVNHQVSQAARSDIVGAEVGMGDEVQLDEVQLPLLQPFQKATQAWWFRT